MADSLHSQGRPQHYLEPQSMYNKHNSLVDSFAGVWAIELLALYVEIPVAPCTRSFPVVSHEVCLLLTGG